MMQSQQPYPPFQYQSSPQSRRAARGRRDWTSLSWTDPTQTTANAGGWITPQQHAMLKQRLEFVPVGCLACLCFITLAPAVFLFALNHQPLFLLLFLVPLGLTLLVLAWPFVENVRLFSSPGPIMAEQGEVTWQGDAYVARTAARQLKMAHQTLDPPPPGPYHFYYLVDSGYLLSAKPISTTTDMLVHPNLLASGDLPGNEQAWLILQNALFSALNFTPYDLEANRRGMLSENQRARLSRRVSGMVIGSLLGLPVSGGFSVASAFLWHQIFWAIFAAWIGLWCLYNLALGAPRKRAEIRRGVAQPSEGYVRARVDEGGEDTPTRYYYDLNKQSFEVNAAAYKALAGSTCYRLYYLPSMHKLLSIEPLEAPRRMENMANRGG